MIQAQGLSKRYGDLKALENVSFSTQPGEIYGVLGPNGAGKSTLFKILCGLIPADNGTYSISGDSSKKIGAIIEKPNLYDYLGAQDNIRLFAGIQNLNLSTEEIKMQMEQVGLSPDRKDKVKNYSMGMRQRLAIAIALLNNPGSLILDEPFSGLDPEGVLALRNLIIELAKEKGLTIMLSSHLLQELERVSDRLLLLSKGQVIAFGTLGELFGDLVFTYQITGTGLSDSLFLKNKNAEFTNDSCLVHLQSDELDSFLRELLSDCVYIKSITPLDRMGKLYQMAKS